jgi:RecA/RadA recombinase
LAKGFSFTSANDCLSRRLKVIHVSTGSIELEELMGCGIETMSITEVLGEFRTGKTQLCHTLCVTSQLPVSQGGSSGEVIYIDAEGRISTGANRPNFGPIRTRCHRSA